MLTTTLRGAVKLFSYRKAHVEDIFLRVPRNTLKELEAQLAAAAGARFPENHTVYEIAQNKDKPPVYVMFSDHTAAFAHTVVERSW